MNISQAKEALDKVINKARVHYYKPIQVAEILFNYRTNGGFDLLNIESYRNQSKRWRDDICERVVGRSSTSSARYQDDLFNQNATPPAVINELAIMNREYNGLVEAYIYYKLEKRYRYIERALRSCIPDSGYEIRIRELIAAFSEQSELRRSIDKIYEIIVYSLFTSLIDALDVQLIMKINEQNIDVLSDFSEFVEKIMKLTKVRNTIAIKTAMYRIGVTNAADCGIDVLSNYGVAIQIKHISLDVTLAEEMATNTEADRIVIVCKDADEAVISKVINSIGWAHKIQSIVVESELVRWYDIAMCEKYRDTIGRVLVRNIKDEIQREFTQGMQALRDLISEREYHVPTEEEWEI